jgi:hypothetical protein
MLTLSTDDFLALGRQLADAAIASFRRELGEHAARIGTPAPTAHPLIEAIVTQHDGRYAVAAAAPRDLAGEIDALTTALVGKGVLSPADIAAGAGPAAAVTAVPGGAVAGP